MAKMLDNRLRSFEKAAAIALGATLVLLITTIVLNAIILSNQPKEVANAQDDLKKGASSSVDSPAGKINDSPGFKAAAKILLQGIDMTVDPCEDFYAFSCNTYLRNNPLPEGARRIGTYDETQLLVNDKVRQGIEKLADTKTGITDTERIVANVYNLCMEAAKKGEEDKSKRINENIVEWFGGFPAILKGSWKNITDQKKFWEAVGVYEAKYMTSSLLSSYVSIDYSNKDKHALYLNQAPLIKPHDFYVKIQFLKEVEAYRQSIVNLVLMFYKGIGGDPNNSEERKLIEKACTDAVKFEIQLALAVVPDDLLRNYKQQLNEYTVDELKQFYPSIEWAAYLKGLGIQATSSDSFVVLQPAYFGVLDVILQGGQWSQETIVNFIVIRLLLNNMEFFGGNYKTLRRQMETDFPSSKDYRLQRDYDSDSQSCVDALMGYIPYGTGYIYVNNIAEREDVRRDVSTSLDLVIESFLGMIKTLNWISEETRDAAITKSQNLVKNVGWPNWFFEAGKLDAYHQTYIDKNLHSETDYFKAVLALQEAFQATENFGLLEKPADRDNFLDSPAVVNAWYQPERNSITFPYAAFNPPYYKLDFPQAYNYAGQGGTAGHELSHGFDDEGVQFGPTGELSNCTWSRCGWMDTSSTLGFINMAQCVVSQYNSQCCPVKSGPVHCANGATTQGENIADLAGQQAAYIAYRKYVANYLNGQEEGRLPGLEQYTPNQIFWITYGYSWCMNWKEETLVKLLLTNPHAPGSCRVNQVVQDIPQFGRDFNCKRGSPMYPFEQNRCSVWTGEV